MQNLEQDETKSGILLKVYLRHTIKKKGIIHVNNHWLRSVYIQKVSYNSVCRVKK
jgi:hypothetical protein